MLQSLLRMLCAILCLIDHRKGLTATMRGDILIIKQARRSDDLSGLLDILPNGLPCPVLQPRGITVRKAPVLIAVLPQLLRQPTADRSDTSLARLLSDKVQTVRSEIRRSDFENVIYSQTRGEGDLDGLGVLICHMHENDPVKLRVDIISPHDSIVSCQLLIVNQIDKRRGKSPPFRHLLTVRQMSTCDQIVVGRRLSTTDRLHNAPVT